MLRTMIFAIFISAISVAATKATTVVEQAEKALHLVPGQLYRIPEINRTVKFIAINPISEKRYSIIVETQ